MNWLAFFLGGFLGSAHCIGMCGGFALAIGATRTRLIPAIIAQLIYSTGRIFTYTFLGASAGAVGLALSQFTGALTMLQQTMSVVAGIFMLVIGISTLTGFGLESMHRRFPWMTTHVTRLFSATMQHFTHRPGRWSFFLAGLFTGFLPCGLVYAFLALAMAAGNPLESMLAMAIFGVGTIPAMVALGCGSSLMSHLTRVRIHRLAACFVVLLGFATIARGLPFVPCHWLPTGGHTSQSDACKCHE